MKARILNWNDFGSDDMIEIRVDADLLETIRNCLYNHAEIMVEERKTENAMNTLETISVIEEKLNSKER